MEALYWYNDAPKDDTLARYTFANTYKAPVEKHRHHMPEEMTNQYRMGNSVSVKKKTQGQCTSKFSH